MLAVGFPAYIWINIYGSAGFHNNKYNIDWILDLYLDWVTVYACLDFLACLIYLGLYNNIYRFIYLDLVYMPWTFLDCQQIIVSVLYILYIS